MDTILLAVSTRTLETSKLDTAQLPRTEPFAGFPGTCFNTDFAVFFNGLYRILR